MSRIQRLAGPAGDSSLLFRLEPPTGTKSPPFVPVGGSNQDKRPAQHFVPVEATNRDKSPPFLSRLVPPTGTKGPPFIPVGASNRDKRGAFGPGWWFQPGQNSLAPLSPSLSPRPSHSAHLFLLFLARERGVLAHFFTTFVKIFDSPSIHRC